ncbi:4-(cytidine 5'-diphospho)-2-C-methyl-D-erythritol kinase [Helicobacter cetorum]|uniref:4-(cytidine 5'-diphospho)-2-C-methyl-D-erythritol kinase n=1 Tax=Helicobacter cetorum (strain ATCC BAA-429 / MIT 00-7128) TaxID=182217 RepID=I0EL10_HELC0|nr:4-(cytidine 5'-diphospho)-2-C-methyl-D-erythritol kinase [Helicobacter cetorum]AFI03629.1 4-diphosphocytidyl-2-C-methyl-D-erythritol kinase [Helicobacter cetorum MIT 00-7128]
MQFSFEVYPKVNIFLKILQKEGTYHKLISRLVLTNLMRDFINIKTAHSFSLKGDFDCPLEENTIFKALQALKNYLKQKDFPKSKLNPLNTLSIEIEKHIPAQAGLGGGSADAGNLLYFLNQAFEFGLNLEELYVIGSSIGMDVNFFISQYTSANVTSYGEVIEAFDEEPLEIGNIQIPKGITCNTKSIYQAYRPSACHSKIDTQAWLKKPSLECLKTHSRHELNDLLKPALQINPALKEFESALGKDWFFSGSGSAFFYAMGVED